MNISTFIYELNPTNVITENSNYKYYLQSKIKLVTDTLINMIKFGNINDIDNISRQLSYDEYGIPAISAQITPFYAHILNPVSKPTTLEELFTDIAKNISKFDIRYFAAVLKTAGFKSMVLPKHYPLTMSDITIRELNKNIEFVDLRNYSFEVMNLDIFISVTPDNIYTYSYAYRIKVTEYKHGESIEPTQSIVIDSNIDYTLFPSAYLHYNYY